MKFKIAEFKENDLIRWKGEAWTVGKKQFDAANGRVFVNVTGSREATFIFPIHFFIEGTIY